LENRKQITLHRINTHSIHNGEDEIKQKMTINLLSEGCPLLGWENFSSALLVVTNGNCFFILELPAQKYW
jgi:hypothetical protein